MVRSNPTRVSKPPQGVICIGEGEGDLREVILFSPSNLLVRGRENNDMQMISRPDLNLPPGDNWVLVLHPHMQIRSAQNVRRVGN